MRSALVPRLRCPACRGAAPLAVCAESCRNDEIMAGTLTCPGCAATFSIRDGIADLLGSGSSVAEAEREVYRRSREALWSRIGGMPADSQEAELRTIAFMEHTGSEFRLTSTLNLQGVMDHVRPKPGEWLVELGAGSGWLTARWAARGLCCIASDISADLKLELAPLVMATTGVYFDRMLADMTRLPLQTGSMDWVFVSASLHHAESLALSLAEAARVLAPTGRVVAINEPMHGAIRRSGKRFVQKAAEETPGLHEQSFSYLQWRAALRAAGLRARFIFPPYYEAILEERVATPAGARALARIGSALWRSPLRRCVLSPPIMAAVRLTCGLNVCMIAERRRTH